MSWVKMDDRWPSNRKLRLVEPLDRLMWVMSIAYTSDQRTDGRLDGSMVEYVAFLAGVTKPYEALERLVAAGLFDLDAGGWVVHDYLAYNPTAKQNEAKSEARARAGRAGGVKSGQARKAKGAGQEGAEANASGVASRLVEANRTPSRPVPSDDSLRSSSSDADDRATQAHHLVAQELASTHAKTNRAGYEHKVLADDEKYLQLEILASQHPDKDPRWLADEHLGRPHPRLHCETCGLLDKHPTEDCPGLRAMVRQGMQGLPR